MFIVDFCIWLQQIRTTSENKCALRFLCLNEFFTNLVCPVFRILLHMLFVLVFLVVPCVLHLIRLVSPFHRPRRPLGIVEFWLYSIFDHGTRWI